MGWAIYLSVEAVLGIASFLCWFNDYGTASIVFLVLFVIGLLPILGDDILDVFSIF